MQTLLEVENLHVQGMASEIGLSLPEGMIGMLSGRSGSGKSQFLKALADLIPHQGQVRLFDHQAWFSQTDLRPDVWRRKVMYFSAESAWWADRIDAHFETPLADDALKALGLQREMYHQNPDRLSSGEKQRFALLRGLQYQPQVLLLDEITANLDPHSEALVEAWVQQYLAQHQAAALWISHSPEQQTRLAHPEFHWVFATESSDQAETEPLENVEARP